MTDVLITFKDQMGGSSSVTFDKLTFTDNGDGTVAVTMPDSYPMTLAFPDEADGPGTLKMTVSQPGIKIMAGGSATETSYQIAAPTTTITLDEVTDETGKVLDTQGRSGDDRPERELPGVARWRDDDPRYQLWGQICRPEPFGHGFGRRWQSGRPWFPSPT